MSAAGVFDEKLRAASRGKALFKYRIPARLRTSDSGQPLPEVITMRTLSADEELQANQIGRFNLLKAQYDAAKRSIVALDGKVVSYPEGEADKFWEAAGPKVRSLILQAYNKAAAPLKEDEDAFFASEEMLVS